MTDDDGKSFGALCTGAHIRVVRDPDDGLEYIGLFLDLEGVAEPLLVTLRADQALNFGHGLISAAGDIVPVDEADVQ